MSRLRKCVVCHLDPGVERHGKGREEVRLEVVSRMGRLKVFAKVSHSQHPLYLLQLMVAVI